MARGRRSNSAKNNGATLEFEAILWAAADKLPTIWTQPSTSMSSSASYS